jgi:diacylglycerol kinase (ATP)
VKAHLARGGLFPDAPWVALADLSRRPPAGPPPERVVAVGGDGTVNGVGAWLLDSGLPADLAIVPGGTGNNVALALGIPSDRRQMLEIALRGERKRRIDALRYRSLEVEAMPGANGSSRFIIQSGAWGYPAEIAGRYAALRRGRFFRTVAYPLGGRIYRLLALAGLLREKKRQRRGEEGLLLQARLPEGRIEADVLAVFVGNDPTLGGGFHPCPRASLEDGLLDLCVVRAGSGAPLLSLLRSVGRGEHLALTRAVEYRQTRGPLELSFNRSTPFLADGDIWLCSSSYVVEVVPAALPVVVGR